MDEYWNAENEQPKEEAIPPVAPPPMEPVNPAVAPPAEAPRQEAHTYQVPPYYAPYQPYYYQPYGYTPPAPPRPTPPPQKPKKEKKQRFFWPIAVMALCCALLGGVFGSVLSYNLWKNHQPEIQLPTYAAYEPPTYDMPDVPPTTGPNGELSLSEIYRTNVPAIVGISNEATYNVFGQTSTTASTGTGFIISPDGEILTNYHVIEGAQTLTVTLSNGASYPARVLGYEADSDVALIKIDVTGLPVCNLGNSDDLYVGAQIAAIGNPLGELTYTMTVGYVSAKDRFVNTDGTPINMMQIDAAINSGNSGGPVFNMYGHVIGISTAKYSGNSGSGASIEGIGFAIPINDVLDILEDLRTNGGVVDRAYLGVLVSTVKENHEGIGYGVLVEQVYADGCAHLAGVKSGDVIIGLGDYEIRMYENLQQALRKYRAGETATITVWRNGEELELEIIFDTRPAEAEPVETQPPTEYETIDPWSGFPFGGFPW
jgi:serine protease Do